MIFIKPAKPEMVHLFPGIADGAGNFNDAAHLETLKDHIRNGIAVVFMADDEPVCLMGVINSSPGVGEGWFRAAPAAKAHLRGIKMAVPKIISLAVAVHQLHRVHTLAKTGYDPGRRFVEFLGFEYEATLKRIGPEASDYDIYLWEK